LNRSSEDQEIKRLFSFLIKKRSLLNSCPPDLLFNSRAVE